MQFTTPTPDSAGFVHPGILVDPSQLSFVQNEIAQGASPWAPALASLNPWYTDLSYVVRAFATVDCTANATSCTTVVDDGIAAYTFALLYSYSTAPDRAKYANAAIAIMNTLVGDTHQGERCPGAACACVVGGGVSAGCRDLALQLHAWPG